VIVFLLCIVVLLIGLTAAAVLGKFGGFMAEPTSSQSFSGVPMEGLCSADVGGLQFDQALRGYRMDQVDEVLDALSARLRELETASMTTSDPAAPAAVDPHAASGVSNVSSDSVSSDSGVNSPSGSGVSSDSGSSDSGSGVSSGSSISSDPREQ